MILFMIGYCTRIIERGRKKKRRQNNLNIECSELVFGGVSLCFIEVDIEFILVGL